MTRTPKLSNQLAAKWFQRHSHAYFKQNEIIRRETEQRRFGQRMMRTRQAVLHGEIERQFGMRPNTRFSVYDYVFPACSSEARATNHYRSGLIFKLQQIRENLYNNGLLKRHEPFRVLDVGHGWGMAALDLALICEKLKMPVEISGTDILPLEHVPSIVFSGRGASAEDALSRITAIGEERARLQREGVLSFSSFPAEILPPHWSGRFHLVMAIHVLQYCVDRVRAIEEMHRVLAPRGEAFVTMDGWNSLTLTNGQNETSRLSFRGDVFPALREKGWELKTYKSAGKRYSYRETCLNMRKTNKVPLITGLIRSQPSTDRIPVYDFLPAAEEFIGLIPTYQDYNHK